MRKQFIKNEIRDLLKVSEAREFPYYHLFVFKDSYQLLIDEKESSHFEVLREEAAMSHLLEHPGTGITLFILKGAKSTEWLNVLYDPEIIEVFQHHAEDLTKFLNYPFAPINKKIPMHELIASLSLEELGLMASMSRIMGNIVTYNN